MRSVIAAAVLFGFATTGTPLAAQETGVYSLVFDLPALPAGFDGTVWGTFSGRAGPLVHLTAAATGGFSYFEPPEVCPLVTNAGGTLVIGGSWTVTFNWQRLGAVWVMTTDTGGTAAGVVQEVRQLVCGERVTYLAHGVSVGL